MQQEYSAKIPGKNRGISPERSDMDLQILETRRETVIQVLRAIADGKTESKLTITDGFILRKAATFLERDSIKSPQPKPEAPDAP